MDWSPYAERDRLRALRESLAERRRTLSAAKFLPVHPAPPTTTATSPPTSAHPATGALSRQTQELASLSATLARARSGLVQELVEVFNVVEVGGRPPIGGKAGTKGEWTIGDLILPVPGDIRRECFCGSVCSLVLRIDFYRIPTRSYQCCHNAYNPLSVVVDVLPWHQASFRNLMGR